MAVKIKVSFLGAGNMGSALVKGAIKSGFLKPSDITIYDLDLNRLENFKEVPLKIASSLEKALKGSDYIFLCVKPQQMKELLLNIKDKVNEKQCLISIAAGVRIKSVEKYFLNSIPVIRVMPNTPALVGCGMAAVTGGRFANKKQVKFSVDFFSSVGKAVIMPEKHFDAVTAISGSGPAYFFYLTEMLEEAALKLGLPANSVELFSKQTMIGSAKMLLGDSMAKDLRKKVTSPGGTTEAAIKHLEKRKWSEIFLEAARQAKERSKTLSLAN
ncbi:MAG: pyrroline-5-carboxylate reductase [Elusimicrobia bacterium]|nr:pyrroline-5-carboxylate reductase [Elusimicrobiota bacterium]